MIVRPQQHWLRRIFVWHGSVLSKISSRLLLNFLFSIAVIFMLPWYTHLGIKFTLAPFSILGVAIAIFLGFRNNAGYARYVEARKLWGQLMIASRSLLREVKTTLPDSASVREFARLQIAFAHCLRMTLRKQPQAEVLAQYLKTEDLQRVLASNSPANRILLIMGEWLAVQRRNGQLSDILFISLNDRLNDISAVLAGCERIAYTPIPFAYTLILHRTVYLFCIMLPFALVVDLHYMTPFISVLISYTFISLDCLAEELEDPFGTENNDLPLDAICNAIEIDLLQMNDEAEIPAKILPDRALAVKRFDRRWNTERTVLLRLPQEDMCQTFGLPSSVKYESDGGPGIAQIMAFLMGSSEALKDRYDFMKFQVFQWLIGATDGHAKNFSVFIQAGGSYRLTPFYDIISAFPVLGGTGIHISDLKLAMGLNASKGKKTAIDKIYPRHFLATAKVLKFPEVQMHEILSDFARMIPAALDNVKTSLPTDFPENVVTAVETNVLRLHGRLSREYGIK